MLSQRHSRDEIARLATERDSAAAREQRVYSEDQSLLSAGDTLPSVTLLSIAGDSIDLQRLPPKYKYLYFGRSNCPGCMILRPVLDAVPSTRRDSIVMIGIDPDSNITPVKAGAEYAWVHRRGTRRRFVVHIPTLVVRATDNRVLASAHGSMMRVAALFDLFGVLRKTDVSAALEAAELADKQSKTAERDSGQRN